MPNPPPEKNHPKKQNWLDLKWKGKLAQEGEVRVINGHKQTADWLSLCTVTLG